MQFFRSKSCFFSCSIYTMISVNYYGNVSNLVRCVVKDYYDKTKATKERRVEIHGVPEFNPLSLLIDEKGEYIEVDFGRCYSQAFLAGKTTDCDLHDGCCYRCRYFYRVDRREAQRDMDRKASKIDAELEYVARMLKSEELEKMIDEYQQRMLELESDVEDYALEVWKQKRKEYYGEGKET